jgi:hypothetical protein
MRMLLNLPDPSPDWRGLAHVISKSDGLRDDVTFVVERDRLRFFDSECREITIEFVPGTWTDSATIAQLSQKLSLLDWLHERFPRESAELPVNRGGRFAASFFKDEDGGSGSRLAASQSTS